MNHNRKILYLAGFLFAAPVALMSYINSSFLSAFAGEKVVGVAYILGSIASILALLIAPRIFSSLGGYKFLLWVTALDALSILLFAFSKSALSAVFIFICGFALNTIIIFSLDEILKIFSKNSSTGKTRGVYLTMYNLAWVLAQLSFATILGKFTFKTIYLVAFAAMVSFFIFCFLKLREIPDPKYDQLKTIKFVTRFFRNKNLARSFWLGLLLHLFFSWMVIYTPIYLSAHLGFSWREIGFIFTVMLLPFVILPSDEGKYSDKIGERKMLMLGFFITSLSTLAIFFIQKPEIWIWALALFCTRVGASSIETMNDVYFLKHIKPENEEWVGVYRSALPLAYILGPLLALAVLAVIPSFKFIFLVLGAIMLSGVYISSTIRKSDV